MTKGTPTALHRRKRLIRKIGMITLACLLIISFSIWGAFAVTNRRHLNEIERRREAAAPYELEKNRLEHGIQSFEAKMNDLMKNGSTLTLLLLGADAAIYENVWPILVEMNGEMNAPPEGEEPDPNLPTEDKWHMAATVCFSIDELPGMEGMITVEQLLELMADGWTTAVFIPELETGDVDGYLSRMEAKYEELGIEWTDTVFFEREIYGAAFNPQKTYNSYDEALKAHGITTAIDQVDEGEYILSQNIDHGIWHVRADGWSLAPSKGSAIDNYNELLQYKGGMAFVVEIWHGANREGPTHFIPHFSDESFKRMIVKFCESVVEEKLMIGSASEGRERYEKYVVGYAELLGYYEPERLKMIERLTEVRAILADIYAGKRDE